MRYNSILTLGIMLAFSVCQAETTGPHIKCPPAVTHVPAGDVEYKPGVDAQGWAVAPADLYPPPLSAEDFRHVAIDPRLSLHPYTHSPRAADTLPNAEIGIGALKVDTQSNSVLLGGKNLSGEGESYYSDYCP